MHGSALTQVRRCGKCVHLT